MTDAQEKYRSKNTTSQKEAIPPAVKKIIEFDENCGSDVIVEDAEFKAYSEPDSYKINRKTLEYTGMLDGKEINGHVFRGNRYGFRYEYFTVD